MVVATKTRVDARQRSCGVSSGYQIGLESAIRAMLAASSQRSSVSAESRGSSKLVSNLRMYTTSSVSLSPATPTTGLQHRRVQAQTLAAEAVLHKEYPAATKALIQRVLSKTNCEIDDARTKLDACFFLGDTVVVRGERWTGELVSFVAYDGRNARVSHKGKEYTVDQAHCTLFARADGTVLSDEIENQYEETKPETVLVLETEAAEETVAPVARKKFTLWVDPNEGEVYVPVSPRETMRSLRDRIRNKG